MVDVEYEENDASIDNIEESPEEQLDNDAIDSAEQGVLEGFEQEPPEEEEESPEDVDFK